MKDGMEKMLMAKGGKQDGKMSSEDVRAKMEVLHELLKMAHDAMGQHVKGGMDAMQKVSVMAPDHKSLEAGLEKAKELASKDHMGMEPDDAMGNHMEEEESPDEEKAEMLEGSGNPTSGEESDEEGSPKEEASESPKEEMKEEEEQSLFSKKPSKEMPKKKKLFSMED